MPILVTYPPNAPPPVGPTDVLLTPSNPNILSNSLATSTVGIMSAVGGASPFTYNVVSNTKFQASGSNLQISATGQGNLSPGTQETVVLSVTDANAHTSPTHSYQVNIAAGPTAVNISGNQVYDNATSGTTVSTVTVTGGSPPYSFVDLDSNTNYSLSPTSGNNSSIIVSPTGPGAIGTQHVNIQATDSAGLTATSGDFPITVGGSYGCYHAYAYDHHGNFRLEPDECAVRDRASNSLWNADGIR